MTEISAILSHGIGRFARPALEISLMSVCFYFLFLFLRGTRAIQVLKGAIVLAFIFFAAQQLHLDTIHWLLARVFGFSIVAFLIIFQPELRRALAQLGRRPLFAGHYGNEIMVDAVVSACSQLAKNKIGALVALERESGLKNYIETGIRMDSVPSAEVLQTIFMPNTPLHDGGVIIEHNRIAASACLFPLSQRTNISTSLGTRHRAGLGLSEDTDAVVVIVSEETGIISLAMDGKLTRDLDEDSLKKTLAGLFLTEKNKKPGFWFLYRKGADSR